MACKKRNTGVSMPVGFKNGTEGSLQVAVNAMTSARTPHHFVGINAEGQTAIAGETVLADIAAPGAALTFRND